MCLVASVCVRIYICEQKRAVWGLTTEKSPVSTIYCLFVEFNGKNLLHQTICFGKEIWNHSINRMEEGFRKIVLR